MFYPPKEGPTAKDGIADNIWRENRDMSGELLSKVDPDKIGIFVAVKISN